MNSTLSDQIENDAINVEGFVYLAKIGIDAMKELVSLTEKMITLGKAKF